MSVWNTQANEIFLHAVELSTPDERQAYLNEACRNAPELRAQAEDLLRANECAGSFLEHPAAESATFTMPMIQPAAGTVIGPYKLLEQIGEGGFGVVYMAEQLHPVRRKVALKIIKPGMDSRQVIARFEAERQALALMDHPHIAKVLDAGAIGEPEGSATGVLSPPDQTPGAHASVSPRPYFVMELVKGIPITMFCDQQRLSTRDRLKLFVDVCHAVQHAHQKGIIHRDLKPSNVLVTLHDGTPMVKVIDFGIANATGQQLTDKTLFTGFAQLVGTPLYMSPEQAALSAIDVDTRSDVYSLGVLLYELLTGTTPFSKETLLNASYDELRRIIREHEPPRPSARLSTLEENALSTIASSRQIEPQKLSRHVRGELDWIVMQALEKDRNRRYESASAFAADVERYLHDEPVLACPPSTLYRLRKYARRKRGTLISTVLVVAAVLIGSVVATWQAIRVSYVASKLERAERDILRELEGATDQRYAAEVRLASQLQQSGDSEHALTLLDHWIPTAGERDRRGLEWRLLTRHLRLPGQELLHLSHDVSCVRISPDKKCLVTATDGGVVRRLDLQTRRELPAWETNLTDVRRIAFSSDGALLALISYQAEVVVLDTAIGRVRQRLPRPQKTVGPPDVEFVDAATLIATGCGAVIRVWNAVNGELHPNWNFADETILDCAVSPGFEGCAILSSSSSEQIRYIKEPAGEEHRPWEILGPGPGVYCTLALSHDGRFAAVGTTSGQVFVLDWRTSERKAELTLSEKINELTFSSDDQCLAIAEKTGAVHVWRWQELAEPQLDSGGKIKEATVQLVDDADRATTRQIGEWMKTRDRSSLIHWQAHPRPARSVVFAPDERRVISAGIDGRIMRWSWGHPDSLGIHSTGRVAWAPSRKAVAVSSGNSVLQLYDRQTGEGVGRIAAPAGSHGDLAAGSADGRWLAWACVNGPILCWNPSSGSEPFALPDSHSDRRGLLEFLADSNRLISISCTNKRSIWKCWDLSARKLVYTVDIESLNRRATALSQFRQCLYVLTADRLIAFDAATGQEQSRVPFDGRPTLGSGMLAASPVADLLAIGSARRILLVAGATGQIRHTLVGHLGGIEQLDFTPEGRTLLALDNHGTLKLWQVAHGHELMTWPDPVPIEEFDLSPDGNWLALIYKDRVKIVETAPHTTAE